MQEKQNVKTGTTTPPTRGIMPDPIVKGEFLRRLDKKCWDRISSNRESVVQSLELLKKDPKTSLVDLGIRFGYVSSPEEEEHCRKDWLDQEKGWFKHLPPIEPVIRSGLIKAIEQSIEHELPIDTYWVRAGKQVEVAICRSEHQLTVLIMTPIVPEPEPPDIGPIGKFRPKDKIIIIRDLGV